MLCLVYPLQLIDANRKWSAEWGNLKADSEKKIAQYYQESDKTVKDLQEKNAEQERKSNELEQQILTLKQKLQQEEVSDPTVKLVGISFGWTSSMAQ